MPEEIGNLLVRVTSVGFDEVIESMHQLEEAARGVSSNGALGDVRYALEGIQDCLVEISEGLKEATNGFTGFGTGAQQAGTHIDENTKKLQQNQSVLAALAKAYASFWVMFNAPKKLFDTLDGVAKFNRNLTTMSVNAQMSRGALMALGTAAAAFGGSAEGIAALGARSTNAMQNLRMGKGGGEFEEAAVLYGLDITGSGPGGLARAAEMQRNIVKALGNLQTDEQKLGLKNLLGIDDGTYQMMLKGLAAWDKAAEKKKEYNERLKASEKGTEEWNKATAELKNEWQFLQNEVFKQLGPIVKEIVVYVKDATEFLKEHPALFSTILGLVTAIGTAIAAWKFAKFVGEAAKLIGILRNIKSVAAGDGIGGVGGGASVAGRAASRAAGLSGTLGLAGVGAIGDAGIGMVLYNISKDVLEPWFALWQAVALRGTLTDKQVSGVVATAYGGMGLSDSNMKTLIDRFQVANRSARNMATNENLVQKELLDFMRNGGGGKSVSIERIEIAVSSSAANAEDVAKAVRTELFRQINASIEDAVMGSQVL